MGALDDYIIQAATQRGIDPNIALRVYQSEGGNGYTGDAGTSFGPFQLHYGNGGRGFAQAGMGNDFTTQTGLDARNPNTTNQQVDFALDYAKQHGWGPWYGAKRAGITGMMGIGPSNWQVASNAGAKGDLQAPQQGSTVAQTPMADNTTQTGGNIDIAPLLQNYLKQNTGWGALGPSLMSLGAGIAAGGAPGGGGWGAGLGMGLQAANEVQQQRQHNMLSLAELANSLQQNKAYLDIAKEQAGLERLKANEPPESLGGAVGTLAGVGPEDMQKSMVIGAGGPGFNMGEWLSGKGAAGAANVNLRAAEDTRRKILGLKPATESDYIAALPGGKDDPQAIADKYNKLFGGITRGYDALAAKMPDEWHKANDPLIAPFRTKVTPDLVKQWQQSAKTSGGSQSAGASQASAGGGIAQVNNAADYASIKPGTTYRDPNGKIRTKPGPQMPSFRPAGVMQ